MMEIELSLNGTVYRVDPSQVSVDTSLNTFIREHAKLKGTKFMCLEGGCGSCVVTVSQLHPVTRQVVTRSVNSCLLPVYSCHGADIVTVEGIGSKSAGYHQIQRRLANFHGSQCGFCSPGMVMNMYGLLEGSSNGVTMREVEDALDGNVCRCTGYRPILDAFKTFARDVNPGVVRGCQDIEDLGKCPVKICGGGCAPLVEEPRITCTVDGDGRHWFKVYTIVEIFEVFDEIGDRPYMLVAGNTAHGVYRRRDDLQVFVDISLVEKLHGHCVGHDAMTIGASVTLSEFIGIMQDSIVCNPRYQYLELVAKHVKLVANQSVRNSGTIAGNLMIKHQHPEFPSDIFLLLETVGATIVLANSTTSINVSPLEFLDLDMTQKVLQTITIPALEPSQHLFQSFKIMPVAQNSRAYVNAGFLIKFRKELVLVPERVTICFGGINAVFVHATETEDYLIGRPLFTNETIQNALQLLSTELEPNPTLSEASPTYRKQLAMSLFYKFILAAAPQHTMIVNPRFKSGGSILERALSSGKQSYDTYPSKWPLTQNVPKIEALAQTSGEAEYINDMPDRSNELHAAFVLATEVQSRIAKIDATEALKVKGVVGFYSAKNIPGCNNFMPAELGYPEVEEIFCSGEVGYHGQPVGMVLAESFELANRAAALVDICYERTSRRPVYPTVMDVLDGGAYDRVVNQNFDRHGAQFAVAREGPIKVKGRHDLHGQYHYTMETQTCFCEPIEDGMNVYSSTQSPNLIHVAVSQALGVSANSLNVVIRRAGGAFGAKASRSAQIACACAVAAQLTKRPVRMVLSMETNMAAIGKRHDLRNEYEVNVDENGKINRLSSTYTHGNGASLNEQLAFLTSDLFKNCYQTDRWNLVGNSARTHVPSNTFCRAPGTLDGIAMIENIMEHIAQAVGRDPLEVRLLNISKENKMHTLLPQFRKDVDFDVRRQAIDMFNRQNRWRKRGIAIIPMEYPLEYFGTTNALVSVYYSDGTVAITHGAIEMGQGVNTKVAQVASHVLGIPLEKISVKPTATFTSPNVRPSVHSQVSETAAFAVQKCCEILRERFRPLREQYPSATWEQLVAHAYAANLDLTATHHYQPRQLQAYVIWGAACAELEVDILTGNVQVPRVDILEDVGESMSPGIDIGQVEGSFIMGLGHYLTEALVYNPTNGALVNNRSWNYKVPGVKDIPVDFRVRFLKGSSNPSGVLRAKTAGEPAVSMSPVLTYALRYALRSARKDAGLPDEWIPLGTANTPEKIFLLAGNRVDQYKLH